MEIFQISLFHQALKMKLGWSFFEIFRHTNLEMRFEKKRHWRYSQTICMVLFVSNKVSLLNGEGEVRCQKLSLYFMIHDRAWTFWNGWGRRFGWYLLNHLAASWDHYRHPKIGRRHILMQDALVWQLCFLSMQPIDWFAESVFWLLMSNGKDLYGHTPLALATESGHEKVVEAGQLGIRVGSSLTWPGFEVMNEALASKGEDEPAPADEAWVWRRMHWYGWVSKLL